MTFELPAVRSIAPPFIASTAGAEAANGPAQKTVTPRGSNAFSNDPCAFASVRSLVPFKYPIRKASSGSAAPAVEYNASRTTTATDRWLKKRSIR